MQVMKHKIAVGLDDTLVRNTLKICNEIVKEGGRIVSIIRENKPVNVIYYIDSIENTKKDDQKKEKLVDMVDVAAEIHAHNILEVIDLYIEPRIGAKTDLSKIIDSVRDYLKRYFSDSINIKGTKE